VVVQFKKIKKSKVGKSLKCNLECWCSRLTLKQYNWCDQFDSAKVWYSWYECYSHDRSESHKYPPLLHVNPLWSVSFAMWSFHFRSCHSHNIWVMSVTPKSDWMRP
jgi:hypothetical protein